jgi:uncharacterized damage-inducible protein DinB
MRRHLRSLIVIAAVGAASALPAGAQAAPSVTADLLADLAQVETKMLRLAREIPEDKYSWRPGPGVRSVAEVLMHVAADNYLIPAAIGFTPDPATGIKGSDYNTAVAFEKRVLNKAATIAELEKAFAFMKKSLGETTPARLPQQVQMFGQSFTTQRAWVIGTTHVHEHLGQLIAYARTNGVKPPWS